MASETPGSPYYSSFQTPIVPQQPVVPPQPAVGAAPTTPNYSRLGPGAKSKNSHEVRADSIELVESQKAELVYQSTKMCAVVDKARQFAQSSATVLLTGESGTGKELFARMIHANSRRADRRFVRVNCASLSEGQLESEFFGHERGAFAGALERRIGRFEWADGGTLLLDDVCEIPFKLQGKLLRVLEENEFQRIGSNQDRKINVRVIATSNRDLGAEVHAGNFRADLFHRLNVFQLELPPLRIRVEDVSLLANYFIKNFRQELQKNVTGISKSAMRTLCEYSWPGNVRQLRNVIHRACVSATTNMITPDDLPRFSEPSEEIPAWLMELSLAEVERKLIISNLQRFNGNKTRTAKHLGVTARTLSNKMKLYRKQGLV